MGSKDIPNLSLFYEIPPTGHPGMLLAGVQELKELDSGLKPAGMTKTGFHLSLDPLGREC
jgi:hypothetical protein